ncbi:hypothetical protein LTS18_007052 [Coniosporium uncinatum]|uniref:Uncharacterized protein n=1 Tax=Coniosporium uncinatum TaxID=93489 RepID=A0ACC3DAL0_9PEZI|nr:hypothetical protein LTS18_007052 [Coniosporium uncinatum]
MAAQAELQRLQRLTADRFRKRRNNFLKRANELGQLFDADIYVHICRNRQHYVYNSASERAGWPLTCVELDRMDPAPVMKKPSDFPPVLRTEKWTGLKRKALVLPKPPIPCFKMNADAGNNVTAKEKKKKGRAEK